MYARAYDVITELDDGDADGDGANSFVGLTMTANAFTPKNPAMPMKNLQWNKSPTFLMIGS